MAARRKVTAKEKADVERAVRANEEHNFPSHDIAIVIADEVDQHGKVQVSVTRTAKLNDSLVLNPKPPSKRG